MGPWDTGGFYGIESPAMKKLTLLPALLGLLLSFQSQAANIERVRVTTNFGAFVIEMQRDRAPLTVENFLGYVRADGYTNTLFHRVIANFVIQGGGVGTRLQGRSHAEADLERSRQRPQESARHRGPRARQWSAHRRSPVLRQCRRQRRSRPPAHALGLCGVRPGDRRHGSGRPHQRIAHRRDGTVQAGITHAAGDHPEDRAVDRRVGATRQGHACTSSRRRADRGAAAAPPAPPATPPGNPATGAPPPPK